MPNCPLKIKIAKHDFYIEAGIEFITLQSKER